jgi:hypothetical protein
MNKKRINFLKDLFEKTNDHAPQKAVWKDGKLVRMSEVRRLKKFYKQNKNIFAKA